MIDPFKPSIRLSISSESSAESLQIVWNFAGWKLSPVYVNQTSLNMKLSTKLGGKQVTGPQPPTQNCHCRRIA